jgi:CheY-like chemotaxis protein
MPTVAHSGQTDLSAVSTLVIDDNHHMRTIIKSILQSFGTRNIYEAANAMDGLIVLKKQAIDIVIVDYQMDILDGIEFTQLLRHSKDSPNPFVPVIMLTAYTEKKRVEMARDAGVTEFLSKPIRARDLYSRMVLSLEKPRPFIKAKNYVGPDRRRNQANHSGPERRNTTFEI